MSQLSFRGNKYIVKKGDTVLDTLLSHGHNIPCSCKAGMCHACKMKIVEGNVPQIAQGGLKDTQREEGYFLSCQCKPQEDLCVSLPTEVDKKYSAQVISLNKLSDDIIQLIVKLNQPMSFHAGQFINLWKDNHLHRSYSIANLPSKENLIEMHIRYMPKGELSSWVFYKLKEGDVVDIQGPLGDCFYHLNKENKTKPMLLAGTGTGLAPLYGILSDALKQKHQGKIYFYHGALSDKQLYFVKKIRQVIQKYDSVYYIPVALKSSGFVKDVVEGDLDKEVLKTTDSFDGWNVYLCGDAQMVRKIQKQVFLKGASLKSIHADAFIPHA